MSITFWGKLFSNIGIMTRTMNWKRSVFPRLLFATLLRKKPFSPSVKSYGSKRNSSWQKTVNSEANACSAWRHVFVANFTVRLRLNVFKDTLFYLCLVQNHFQHMCNSFGKSQSDVIIVHRDILKRFERIREFSICTWQACYWSIYSLN